jgi:hypothetical protein
VNAALLDHIWALAGGVGRLRRRVDPESPRCFPGDRIAGHVATIDRMLPLAAAEIIRLWAPDDDVAADIASQLADEHWGRLQARLRTTA